MKSLFITLILISCFSAGAQTHFHLTGEVEGLSQGTKVYLRYTNEKEDSVIAKDNYFEFKGTLDEPLRVYIMIKEPKFSYTSFWVENAPINLKGHIDSLRAAQITGSKINEAYVAFSNATKVYETSIQAWGKKIADAKKSGDSLLVVQLQENLKADRKKLVEFQKEYIQRNPTSFISIENLYFLKSQLQKTEVAALYAALSPALRNSTSGKQIDSYLSLFAEPKMGELAPLFVQNDPEGKPVKLEQFRGKYVLLDFWGTWCAPCIQEMPNLVKTYTAYKDKGFEIVAVAADHNKEIWQKAIKEYKMDWVNVSELKGDQDKVVLTYGINYYPANYLINPEGEIIAKDLRGEKLGQKLEEIFRDR